jgi:hypothetical protein
VGSSDPAIVAEAKVTLARLMDDSAEDLNPRLGQYVTKWTYKWTHTIESHPILCAVYCVLCTVCTVYCVYGVLCVRVLCTAYCVLRTAYCVLRTVYCVLRTVYCVRCTVYGVLCVLCTVCTVYCVLCTSCEFYGSQELRIGTPV